MRCIYCNAPLGATDYCPHCGADISIQKRIARISNLLYNEGLEKALIRDLEGAITCLKRCLKFNKENTDARNLLGLCYYETGEAISALCEWVISKNLQPEDNLADTYIEDLQNNKNRLETINQSICKFNQSVMYCREDNEDMAIIQLRKVINHNPKFVKAYQLLALLYMKRTDYEKARRVLERAAQVDTTNTTSLRYLQEIEEATGRPVNLKWHHRKSEQEEEGETVSGTLRYLSGNEMIIQPTTFRDSSTVATFINIILGILLGGAIVWFLVVPANRQTINDSANRLVTEANAKLAGVQVQAEDLQGEIDDYAQQAQEAQSERDAAVEKTESYNALMEIADLYISGDPEGAAAQILELNADDFDENARSLYDSISEGLTASMFLQYYNEGTAAYVQADYDLAAESLEKAIEIDPNREEADHYNAMLYLAMSYYYQGKTAKADTVFNEIIEYYPEYASVVQGYISSNESGEGVADDTLDLSGLGDAATAGLGAADSAEDADAQEEYADAYEDENAQDYADDAYADEYTDDGYADEYTDEYAEEYAEEYAYEEEFGDDIEIYEDTGTSAVVWTDPTTGLQYDANGNVIYE